MNVAWSCALSRKQPRPPGCINVKDVMFVAFGDSGFANAPNNKSQGGFAITATDKKAKTQSRPASVLEWKSYRHQRVLRRARS